jgi:hypothetical protein
VSGGKGEGTRIRTTIGPASDFTPNGEMAILGTDRRPQHRHRQRDRQHPGRCCRGQNLDARCRGSQEDLQQINKVPFCSLLHDHAYAICVLTPARDNEWNAILGACEAAPWPTCFPEPRQPRARHLSATEVRSCPTLVVTGEVAGAGPLRRSGRQTGRRRVVRDGLPIAQPRTILWARSTCTGVTEAPWLRRPAPQVGYSA